MSKCRVSVYQNHILEREITIDCATTVGRRDARREIADPAPVALNRHADGTQRLIVADLDMQRISRSWFEIRPLSDGVFEIKNLSKIVPVVLKGEQETIAFAATRHCTREVTVESEYGISVQICPANPSDVSSAALRRRPVDPDDESNAGFRSLASIPLAPTPSVLSSPSIMVGTPVTPLKVQDTVSTENVGTVQMLRLALEVVQKANGSSAFFDSAVVATAEIVNLDRAILLVRDALPDTEQIPVEYKSVAGWSVVTAHYRESNETQSVRSSMISRSLLEKVLIDERTILHDPTTSTGTGSSLENVQCAVASPILNNQREVIGVLYGDRAVQDFSSTEMVIDDIEATIVEILAGAVAGGIALKSEEENRSKLTGFFSPKVAELLVTNPALMDGQDAEVTVLFCDVRGFSSVTETLGPKKSIAWINDVMSELSQCVIDRDGVLVDYVGDELLAMWGAPGEQPDHAKLAIEASQAMLASIETLRERWADELPIRFGAGIGLNTGLARVGNIGSRQKFKYGPLGHAVNLGARLQTATKQLGVNCLASEATIRHAKCRRITRRIAKLQVVGIDECVTVYEVVRETDEKWKRLKLDYEKSLEKFENKQFADAARALGMLLPSFPGDHPCLKLLSRTVAELDIPSDEFDSIWRLTSK